LHTVLKMHEAATSAFCGQDEGLASQLALKNGSKTMHLYQRFAVKWMVDREQSRGRLMTVPPAATPAATPAAAPAAAPAVVHLYRPHPGVFDIRDGIGHPAPLRLMKMEAAAEQPCTATAYADALQRLAPTDFVNLRSSGCSLHRNPVWEPLPPALSCSCTQYYWNTLTGSVCVPDREDRRAADFSPFGGLLCDQMGIGKVSACSCVSSPIAIFCSAHAAPNVLALAFR